MDRTVDDVSSASEDLEAVPAIVMVATGTQPASLVLPVPAELGRRIAAGGKVQEVDDERMSRDHALVTLERGPMWAIKDRDSRNGTFVNGERITGEIRLRGDVVVRLGHTVFVLLADGRGHGHDNRGENVVGPELERAYDLIRRYGELPILLLHGEPGSGKELAARLYHDSGPHRSGPFVAIDCGALPTDLAEGLLFGSKKGAFTGAVDRPGYFQAASGGTLFLDEIAELAPEVQAKLLRVLQERVVIPVGAAVGTPVELGIVAASHKELRQAVHSGRFREDLFYRIGHTTVSLPPLRARKVDIARLVQREVAAVSPSLVVHARLIEACCMRPWPGNVRELRAAVRQAATDALAAQRANSPNVVKLDDLPATAGLPIGSAGETAVERPKSVSPAALDKETIVAAIARAGGNLSGTARALGLHRNQLYRAMDKFGIKRDDDDD